MKELGNLEPHRRRLIVSPEKRASFLEEVSPLAKTAKGLNVIEKRFTHLTNLNASLSKKLLETEDPEERERLQKRIDGNQRLYQGLGGYKEYKKTIEDNRKARNKVIEVTENLRVKEAVEDNIVPIEAAVLARKRAQIQTSLPLREFQQPHSPPLAHNDMGALSVNRAPGINNPRIERAIIAHANIRWPGNKGKADITLAMVKFMPNHVMTPSVRSVPEFFKETRAVIEGLCDLTALVEDTLGDKLEPAPISEIQKSPEQKERELIGTHLSSYLGQCLAEEVTNPNMDENSLRKLYQGLSKSVKTLSENLGSQGEEKVKRAIEALPDTQALVLVSRLSTSLLTELDFPSSDMYSEEKMAELLRNISFSGGKEKRYHLLVPLLAIIENRIENNSLDAYKTFASVANILNEKGYNYSLEVVERLHQVVKHDIDALELFIKVLESSGHFQEEAAIYRQEAELDFDDED